MYDNGQYKYIDIYNKVINNLDKKYIKLYNTLQIYYYN